MEHIQERAAGKMPNGHAMQHGVSGGPIGGKAPKTRGRKVLGI